MQAPGAEGESGGVGRGDAGGPGRSPDAGRRRL